MKKTIVIAGSNVQFKEWCRIHGVSPNAQDSPYVYASRREVLMGIDARDILFVGTYYDRNDYEDILREAQSRIR